LLVGALGIFKAGGAYVPMDWTYPPERVRFMLEDTKAPLVVTQSTLLKHVPASSARLVCLDSDWEHIAERSTANPQKNGRSSDVAYVMYTSGSTGVSKGVALEHRNGSVVHSLGPRGILSRRTDGSACVHFGLLRSLNF
jgi:non-ribosomal peptide synthetase component F